MLHIDQHLPRYFRELYFSTMNNCSYSCFHRPRAPLVLIQFIEWLYITGGHIEIYICMDFCNWEVGAPLINFLKLLLLSWLLSHCRMIMLVLKNHSIPWFFVIVVIKWFRRVGDSKHDQLHILYRPIDVCLSATIILLSFRW